MEKTKIKIGNSRSWRHFFNRKTTIVLVIALVAIAGTTVAVMERLSNRVQASVTIADYPLALKHSTHETGAWTTGQIDFGNICRGCSIIEDLNITNTGTDPVHANLVLEISCTNGFTFDQTGNVLDFNQMCLDGPGVNLMDYLGAQSNNHTLYFEYPITVTPGEPLYADLDMVFSDNASGSYTINAWCGYLDY